MHFCCAARFARVEGEVRAEDFLEGNLSPLATIPPAPHRVLLKYMRTFTSDYMKNPRLLFWGSFIGAIVIVVAVVALYSLQDSKRVSGLSEFYAHWPAVEGKVNAFEARFPAEPEYASENLPIPDSQQKIQQEIFVAGSKDMSYFVATSLYPEELTGDEEESLKTALNGMMQTIPGTQMLSSQYIVPFSGNNYLEFEFLNPDADTHFKGRVYLVGKSLYQIYTSYPKASYNDNEYTYFVNSFRIM